MADATARTPKPRMSRPTIARFHPLDLCGPSDNFIDDLLKQVAVAL